METHSEILVQQERLTNYLKLLSDLLRSEDISEDRKDELYKLINATTATLLQLRGYHP